MGLNKSKGNMYPWITHTWNPLGGECPHKCSYCSTNKLMRYPAIKEKYTGKQRFIKKELTTDLGSGNIIFVCAQNDLFAGFNDITYDEVYDIIAYLNKFDNTYLLQTKNPFGTNGFIFPEKTIFCTTIETNRWYPEIMKNCPTPIDRAFSMPENSYITIEPIMDFNLIDFVAILKATHPKQINIGADSGNNNLPEPPKEKILQLMNELEKFTIVKQKKNLKRLLK